MNRDYAINEEPASKKRTPTNHRMTLLADDFEPSDDDVICGRGKKCYNHIGNERFRRRVLTKLADYRKARSKLEKSRVLCIVVEEVRKNSPRGGFVKQDENGSWYEVGDFLAREKTSQAFRDALHDNYKSSNVSKKKRRQEEQSMATEKMQKLSFSGFDKPRMDKLNPQFSHEPFHRRQEGPRMEMRVDRNDYFFKGSNEQRLSETNTIACFEFEEMDRCGVQVAPIDQDAMMHDDSHLIFRQRAHSVPSSPMNFPSVQDFDSMHHSMPDMNFSFPTEPMIDEGEAMHHSLPNIDFETEDQFDADPLPFTMAVPYEHRRSSRVDEFGDMGMDWETDTLSHPGASLGTRDAHISNQQGVSRDLMACLEKLTESSISDDPYEPIPLTPQEQRRQTLEMAKAGFPKLENPLTSGESRDGNKD